MKLLLGMVIGAVVGAVAVALLLSGSGRDDDRRRGGVWRERAETYERELTATRRQRDTIAAELQQLTERFNTLASRFDALAAVTPAPPGEAVVPVQQWDALVTGDVNAEIAERLAPRLPAAQVQALLASVQEGREKARVLIATATVTDSAEQMRLEVDRGAILAQVDATFRDQLGIGLVDFMNGVDPN